MLAAAASFMLSPAGKFAREATLVLGLLFVGWLLLQQHDARVLAEQNSVTQQAIAAKASADAARTIAVLQRENAEAEQETTVVVTAKRNIANAPDAGCPDPAVRAALDGLRPAGSRHITHPKPAN